MRKSLLPKIDSQQRLVITFSRGEELKYISHLDMMRLWHRAIRRAGMPLAYSQGYNPQPRIAIAAPLAVGVTSEGELIDVILEQKVSLDFFVKMLSAQLPDGINLIDIKDMWVRLPSLQSRVRFADYLLTVEKEMSVEDADRNLRALLERESLFWQHYRGAKIHKYDIRRLIDDLWIAQEGETVFTIGMRLRNDLHGAGRPEQVMLALGFIRKPRTIHRTKLIMEAT